MKYLNPQSYTKTIHIKVDMTLGYSYFIDRTHPLSNKSGKVYYHRHVYSVKIGKWVDKSYHIHHKDGDKTNNTPSNLEAISPRNHNYRRHKERGFIVRKVKNCPCCNEKFISTEDRKCCSQSCASSLRNKELKNKIPEDRLKELVWIKPTTEIAKEFNCSDVSIAKLCKKYGIKKPPRGYWSKK